MRLVCGPTYSVELVKKQTQDSNEYHLKKSYRCLRSNKVYSFTYPIAPSLQGTAPYSTGSRKLLRPTLQSNKLSSEGLQHTLLLNMYVNICQE